MKPATATVVLAAVAAAYYWQQQTSSGTGADLPELGDSTLGLPSLADLFGSTSGSGTSGGSGSGTSLADLFGSTSGTDWLADLPVADIPIWSAQVKNAKFTSTAVLQNEPVNVRAFSEMIADCEGTRAKNYATLYGGSAITDFSNHPSWTGQAAKGSTASGRYQIMRNTWSEWISKLGPQNFSPETQDKWYLYCLTVKRPGLRAAIVNGDFRKMLDIASNEWASIPDPATGKCRYPPPNHSKTVQQCKQWFLKWGGVIRNG